ncbi:PREDICTED: odorant receptor 13a-like isoform X2 [Vollenhovia emeryi]|uniref:odorant receptor 13a-like isoform X2 n=1 Tax=Vollenhovia emeryi TaxID=411798 RepID=UPI0005F40C18|nr:PREDICTED: odorant receptor 13a-like isoform X2 [Vollenhovia emeryi]
MSFYDNHYYYFNKTSLCIIGQWPFQSRLRNNAMAAVTVFFISSLTALELWGLLAGITDLSIIMENTSPLLVCVFIIVKLVNCFMNNYKMKELLENIEETWNVMHVGPENKILRQYAEENKILSKRYAIGLYMMWLFYTTPPIIITGIYTFLPTNETYSARFLYRMEHVLDMDKYYNLLMLHGFIGVFYIVSVPIAVDSLFTLCVQHVGALFTCVKYNLEQVRGSKVVLDPDIADDEAYHSIISCIKLYKRILNFGSAELVMVDIQFDEIVRIIASNVAQLGHIYYLSLTSQRLIDYSDEIHNIVYSCNWHSISLRSRSLLIFTLMRTTKPCQVKAGNMFVMSLESFSAILKMTMSYFTMLTSMQ